MSRSVLYIPSVKDKIARPALNEGDESRQLQQRAQQGSPLRRFLEDASVLFRKLGLLPWVILPLGFTKPLPGVHIDRALMARDWMLTFVLIILEVILLPLYLWAVVFLPGWTSAAFIAISFSLLFLVIRILWNKSLVMKSTSPVDGEARFAHEKWFFINGVGTSYYMAFTTVNMLAATFGRPVIGIHNRSFGVIFDIIECLIQRNFNYETYDIRVTYEALKDALEDPDKRLDKVVVLCHSQGGILVSLALERLYANLPAACFDKLEVYTFGSAAAHFYNPLRTVPPCDNSSASVEPHVPVPRRDLSNHYIRTVEHYCNEYDLVPQWGVLYHMSKGKRTYSGRAFVRKGATGHLFDVHYLAPYFPLPKLKKNIDDPTLFINEHVDVDNWNTPLLRASSFTAEVSPSSSDSSSNSEDETLSTNGPKTNGKVEVKVRDVSRLWRYVGGLPGPELA